MSGIPSYAPMAITVNFTTDNKKSEKVEFACLNFGLQNDKISKPAINFLSNSNILTNNRATANNMAFVHSNLSVQKKGTTVKKGKSCLHLKLLFLAWLLNQMMEISLKQWTRGACCEHMSTRRMKLFVLGGYRRTAMVTPYADCFAIFFKQALAVESDWRKV